MPASRKLLCAVYGLIALAALVATWSQNLAYRGEGLSLLATFVQDTRALLGVFGVVSAVAVVWVDLG